MKFEHAVDRLPPAAQGNTVWREQLQGALNARGADGWELVALDIENAVCVWKRPLVSDSDATQPARTPPVPTPQGQSRAERRR